MRREPARRRRPAGRQAGPAGAGACAAPAPAARRSPRPSGGCAAAGSARPRRAGRPRSRFPADQVGLAQHLHDRRVLVLEPGVGHLGRSMNSPRSCIARKPQASTLSARSPHAQASPTSMRSRALGRQRDALEEEPLVALDRQVGERDGAAGADTWCAPRSRRRRCPWPSAAPGPPRRGGGRRARSAARRPGRRDRRHRLAAALGGAMRSQRSPHPVGRGPELAVEVAGAVHRAHDRVQRDHLEAELVLVGPPERLDDLLEGEDQVDVARLAPQPGPRELAHARGGRAGSRSGRPRRRGRCRGASLSVSRAARQTRWPAVIAQPSAAPRSRAASRSSRTGNTSSRPVISKVRGDLGVACTPRAPCRAAAGASWPR